MNNRQINTKNKGTSKWKCNVIQKHRLPTVKFNMNKITKTKDALKISGQGSSIARIGIQRIHQTQ